MPFPSAQRSKPSAPQSHAGGQNNAIPVSVGTKKQEGAILESGGTAPSKSEWETGTSSPKE